MTDVLLLHSHSLNPEQINALKSISLGMPRFTKNTPAPPRASSLRERHKLNMVILERFLLSNDLHPPSEFLHLLLHPNNMSLLGPPPRDLLTSRHWAVKLKQLLCDLELFFIPADKEQTLCLIPKQIYISAVKSMLDDTNTYIELTHSRLAAITKCERNILLEATHFFDGFPLEEALALDNQRTFFGLPKTHKESDTWPIPHLMPKLRPVLSNIQTKLYKLAKLLLPSVQHLQSLSSTVLTSSLTLIQRIKEINQTTSPDTMITFISIDISDMYTNVPLPQLVDLLSRKANLLPKHKNPAFSSFFLRAVRLILHNNYFQFQGVQYIQKNGLPMGGVLSGALADIYLADKELPIVQTQDSCSHIILFARYADDILIISKGTQTQIEVFTEQLQSAYNIPITVETSKTSVVFLDTRISKSPSNQLQLELYSKNPQILTLPLISDHRERSKIVSLATGQFLRLWRLSSTNMNLNNSVQIIRDFLPMTGLANLHNAILSTFLNPVSLKRQLYHHTHVLCEQCVQISRIKNVEIEKAHNFGNNITIASRKPVNCGVSNFSFLISIPPNEMPFISKNMSLHELLRNVTWQYSIIVPLHFSNDKQDIEILNRLQTLYGLPLTMLEEQIYPPFLWRSCQNTTTAYGIRAHLRAENRIVSIINPHSKLGQHE